MFGLKFDRENWREPFKHYSTWGLLIAAFVLIAHLAGWTFLGWDYDVHVLLFWIFAALGFGLWGKFVVQTEDNRWIRRAALIAILAFGVGFSVKANAHVPDGCDVAQDCDPVALAVTTIKRWEGSNKVGDFHVVYLDRIASAPVATCCYGDTQCRPVGSRYTDLECETMLSARLPIYRAGWQAALDQPSLIPCKADAALTSFTWNVGIAAAQGSTAIARFDRGDQEGGCEAMTWYNRAGGKIILGLKNRRAYEYQLCMAGIG